MTLEELSVNRAVVAASALIYWGGVLVQARRVRRHIGRSPNLRPRGLKERLLWLGWALVVAGWLGEAFLIGRVEAAGLRPIAGLMHPACGLAGIGLVALGYAGTLWCYAALGDRWRIGIDRKQKTSLVTRGPYRRVRHPIYLFQTVMLAGAFLLLPAAFSLGLVLVHLVCVVIKAADEEAHLLATLGEEYRQYLGRTGRLLPRISRSDRGGAG